MAKRRLRRKGKDKKKHPMKFFDPTWDNLVIGLTGPIGSGCSTMAKVLEGMQEYLKALEVDKFHRYKISNFIEKEIPENKNRQKHHRNWRKRLQDQGNKQRQTNPAYWAEKVIAQIRKDTKKIRKSPIVIDGIRNFNEIDAFRRAFTRFYLVALYAEKENRQKRAKQSYGEYWAEFDRDDKRDQNEDIFWGQTVSKCVDEADYVFCNNEQRFRMTTKGEEKPDESEVEKILETQAEEFLPLMLGKQGRSPTPEELQMAAAYALSNASSCEKRHVGAVITIPSEGRNLPISMGFNENPSGIPTCRESGGCFKDNDLESYFKSWETLYCPECGTKLDSPTVRTQCGKCHASLKSLLRPNRGLEICTAIHAEERAIRTLGDRTAKGGTLYVTTFPCFQCARLVLDVGIKRIVYVEAYPGAHARKLLDNNGCKAEPFSGFTARAFFRVFPRIS